MEMTWEIWDWMLGRNFSVKHEGDWKRWERLDSLQLWDGTDHCAEHMIYLNIDSAGKKNAGPGESRVLTLLTEQEYAEVQDQTGYYILCGEEGRLSAANRVLRLWNEGEQWLEKLREEARIHCDMKNLISAAARYLRISIVIVNSAYEIHDFVDDEITGFRWEDLCDENGRMTREAIESLYLDTPDFDNTFSKSGLQKYVSQAYNWSQNDVAQVSWYYNFMDENGHYLGRILFAGACGDETADPPPVYTYIAKEAEYCFMAFIERNASPRLSRSLHEIFEKLLDGESISRASANDILRSNDWKASDQYTVYKMVSNGNVHSSHTLAYYAHLLEGNYTSVLAVEKNDSILCLYNQSFMKEQDTFSKNIPYFLRENLFVAGGSCSFDDFFTAAVHAREAAYALETGLEKNGSFWLHMFPDYALDYCLRKITEDYPAEDLIFPGLRLLEQYDREHPGSDFAATLQRYIELQFNATCAAEELHIHRTTLLYRLRRIHELTGMRLDDRQTLLRLEISFALREEQ